MLEAERKPTHLTLQVAASVGLPMSFGTHIFHFVLSICQQRRAIAHGFSRGLRQLLCLVKISRPLISFILSQGGREYWSILLTSTALWGHHMRSGVDLFLVRPISAHAQVASNNYQVLADDLTCIKVCSSAGESQAECYRRRGNNRD